MDETTFRAGLARDGYDEVLVREVPADVALATHHHAWDSRVMLLSGGLRLTQAGAAVDYRAGQWFDVPRDAPHAELHGPQGAVLLIGRRHSGGGGA